MNQWMGDRSLKRIFKSPCGMRQDFRHRGNSWLLSPLPGFALLLWRVRGLGLPSPGLCHRPALRTCIAPLPHIQVPPSDPPYRCSQISGLSPDLTQSLPGSFSVVSGKSMRYFFLLSLYVPSWAGDNGIPALPLSLGGVVSIWIHAISQATVTKGDCRGCARGRLPQLSAKREAGGRSVQPLGAGPPPPTVGGTTSQGPSTQEVSGKGATSDDV